MTGAYTIRPAVGADSPRIETLLTGAQLPLDGVADALASFFVAEHTGDIIGVAGLEVRGDVALLRSVAVAPEWRGQRVGKALVERAIGEADARGLSGLYLLTTTAGAYFPRFGFAAISREGVPRALLSTAEFTSACPDSAVVMERRRSHSTTAPSYRLPGSN